MAKKPTNSENPEAAAPENESAPVAPSTEVVKTSGPSKGMLALFSGTLPTNAVRLTLPGMYKPDDIPVGAVVSGLIVKIIDSPVSTIKGKLLWLRHESGVEFTFPATGVIRSALAPGVEKTKEESDFAFGERMLAAMKHAEGKHFFAKRNPNKESKYDKEMFMWDVYLVDAAKA